MLDTNAVRWYGGRMVKKPPDGRTQRGEARRAAWRLLGEAGAQEARRRPPPHGVAGDAKLEALYHRTLKAALRWIAGRAAGNLGSPPGGV